MPTRDRVSVSKAQSVEKSVTHPADILHKPQQTNTAAAAVTSGFVHATHAKPDCAPPSHPKIAIPPPGAASGVSVIRAGIL